jgi:hypothetical protein
MLRTRAATAAAGAMLLPMMILAACGPAARSGHAATSVKMVDCFGRLQARPDAVQVICQSDAITARSLAWSGWGKPVATATGVAVYDWCAFEDCHTGIYNTAPIVIVASKIVTCPKRTRAYSRLQYVFVGHSPFSSLPAHMKFSNMLFGSHRPGPAANQTVMLGC